MFNARNCIIAWDLELKSCNDGYVLGFIWKNGEAFKFLISILILWSCNLRSLFFFFFFLFSVGQKSLICLVWFILRIWSLWKWQMSKRLNMLGYSMVLFEKFDTKNSAHMYICAWICTFDNSSCKKKKSHSSCFFHTRTILFFFFFGLTL